MFGRPGETVGLGHDEEKVCAAMKEVRVPSGRWGCRHHLETSTAVFTRCSRRLRLAMMALFLSTGILRDELQR